MTNNDDKDTTTVRQQRSDHWSLWLSRKTFLGCLRICTTGKVTHWKWQEVNGNRKLTHRQTVQYKHYENAFLSCLILYKVSSVLNQLFLLLIWSFDILVICRTVSWYWQTIETGLMHHINNICIQTNHGSQINQKILYFHLNLLTLPPMHYTIVLNFHILHLCYILLIHNSLIIKANISQCKV